MKVQVLLLSMFFCCSVQAMDWNIERSPKVDLLVKNYCSGKKTLKVVRNICELVTRPSGEFDSSLIYGAPELGRLVRSINYKKQIIFQWFQGYTQENTTLLKLIKEYLEMGGSPNNVDCLEDTLLHKLCETNSSKHIEIIEYLIKQKNIKFDVKNCRGQTPLYLASKNLLTQAIKLLLQAGAEKEFTIYCKRVTWREVLHEAILKCRHRSALVVLEMGMSPMLLPRPDDIAEKLNELSDDQMLNWHDYV